MYAKQSCEWYRYRLLNAEEDMGMEIEDLAGYLPPEIVLISTGNIHCFQFTTQDQFSFQDGEHLQAFFSEFINEFPPPYQMVFNLKNLEYLSNMEIGVFSAIVRAFADTGNTLVACGLSPQLTELFELFQLDEVMGIVETEAQAFACFDA